MPLAIEILQEFFGTPFSFEDQSFGQLTHFDSYAYWHILYIPERQFLKIFAGRDSLTSAFPTVEIEGIYSDCSISPLTGGGTALILRPKGVDNTSNYVVITKTKNGTLSLSTTVGEANPVA
jgi:hypothetical protein